MDVGHLAELCNLHVLSLLFILFLYVFIYGIRATVFVLTKCSRVFIVFLGILLLPLSFLLVRDHISGPLFSCWAKPT